MVSASAVDDRCFIEGNDSGLLQPLELCVPPPSPKLCITPPTPSIVSPTSPPLSNEQPKESLLPTVVGPGMPGVAKLKSKKKKSRHPVVVLPRYLAAGSKIDHSLTHRHHLSRPEYGRHLSQPAVDVHGIASSCKKMGQSTQSLTSTLEESSLRNLLRQEDMRAEAHCGGRIYRGLRAIRLFPQNKLSKKLIALRTRLQPDSSVDEKESETSNVNVGSDRVQITCAKKSKVKFERQHSRSSSDSMAAAVIRSLMDSNTTGLDRVVEVKESPGSSPSSPSRRESYTSIELSKHAVGYSDKVSELDSSPVHEGPPDDVRITVSESFLRLPSNDDGPELRYVDGHLISNTSSNVSSTSDSSSSEEDASEDYSLDVPIMDKSLTYCTSATPVIPSQLDVMNTVSFVQLDCGSNVGELHSPVVNGNSTDITPITNVPVIELTTVDSPQTISTTSCLAGTEQTNAYCFGEGKTNVNLYQQESKATNSASLVEKVNMTTILCQSADTWPVTVQQNNDSENVPSFVNKIARNTKTDFERNYSFSLPVNDSGKNIPISTAGDYVSVEVPSNYNCTPCMHTEKMKSKKEYLVLQDSGIDNNHPSYASMSKYSTKLMQENMLSVSEETMHTVETSSSSDVLSLPQNENISIATPGPSTNPNVLPNQENVTYVSASVEEGSINGLSAGNSVHVSPLVKTDNDNSACKLDVVLDVSDSCKTNSVIGMQNLPVGKVSVGMLNIPTSPLHKSQSATTLCSCPTATVKHDTNDEQASPCCGGDLQFHNIKHGPCFVPPSRQQQQQLFSGGEEERQLTGSPQQARPVSSTSSKISPSPAKLSNLPAIHRRSSDSDLSITPKGKLFGEMNLVCNLHQILYGS